MAGESEIRAKIIDMAPVADRMRVSVEFDDGKGKPWHQAFDIKIDRPISLEEFAVMISKKEIERPVEPYRFLEEAKDSKTVFSVKLKKTV